MWAILFILARDHLKNRPFRALLTITGVAIGVSAWLAIRTANTEVYQSFEDSVNSVAGEATLTLSSGRDGLAEGILEGVLQHPDVQSIQPRVRIFGRVSGGSGAGRLIPLLGVDMLEYGRFFFPKGSPVSSDEDWEEMFSPRTVFLGQDLANLLGIHAGEGLVIESEGKLVELRVRGVLESRDIRGKRFGGYAVMDIASAQWLFDRVGRVHAVDIVPQPGTPRERLRREVTELIPASVTVGSSSHRTNQVEGMLKAFQMNLTVLSGIALMVGLFLVYNTMAFSVAQHRKEIGILRSLGFEQGAIHRLFLLEAGLLGLLGGVLGSALGVWMAGFLLALIGQTVGELYGVQATPEPAVSFMMLIEGAGVGTGVSLLGAFRPSWEASRLPPVQALSTIPSLESGEGRLFRSGRVVLAALLAGAVLAAIPPVRGIPWGGYGAALCWLIGGTALGPVLFAGYSGANGRRNLTESLGVWPSLALEQMSRHAGRTYVTLSAIIVGLSIMVGVGLMIKSFRQTVQLWVDQTMVADVIVAPVTWLSNDEEALSGPRGIPLTQRQVLKGIAGVEAVDPYRETRAMVKEEPVSLVARDLRLHRTRSRYVFVHGDSSSVLNRTLESSGILVSEILAQRLALEEGQIVSIQTPTGTQEFKIAGIFYDYATDGGKIVLDELLYREYWPDVETTVFAVYLAKGSDPATVRESIERSIGREVPVTTISNGELRTEILEIFDRTFRVTYVLELIALSVAVLGIINTLMTAIMERRRELATLRALGASLTQIKGLMYWEAGFLAFGGAAIGIVTGVGLSLLLTKVVNKQSFGWTIQWHLSWEPVAMALLVAVAAVCAGAWWPARWAGRQAISEGLRYE